MALHTVPLRAVPKAKEKIVATHQQKNISQKTLLKNTSKVVNEKTR